MLVLSNPPPAGWAVKRLEGLVATEESEAVPIKTSLIVVPANLLGQVGRPRWVQPVDAGAGAQQRELNGLHPLLGGACYECKHSGSIGYFMHALKPSCCSGQRRLSGTWRPAA